MPQGKPNEPFAKVSIPSTEGSCCGKLPFVCRLFPLQPGYVMIVCALASATRHNVANRFDSLNILPTASRVAQLQIYRIPTGA